MQVSAQRTIAASTGSRPALAARVAVASCPQMRPLRRQQSQVTACSLTAHGMSSLRSQRVMASQRASRGVRSVAVRAEISYVMVKPDGVQRGLVGEIISRFERKGFKLVGLKLYQTPKEVAEEHYKELSSKPFYNDLVKYIVSGPVVAMVWEGDGMVASARKLIGATNPLAAEPGTIRGDYAIMVGRNIVHGSDSIENGERETALWFPEGVTSWSQTMYPWLVEERG